MAFYLRGASLADDFDECKSKVASTCGFPLGPWQEGIRPKNEGILALKFYSGLRFLLSRQRTEYVANKNRQCLDLVFTNRRSD